MPYINELELIGLGLEKWTHVQLCISSCYYHPCKRRRVCSGSVVSNFVIFLPNIFYKSIIKNGPKVHAY